MSKMFLTQTEQPLTELCAPGVYRAYPGSNTIILTQVFEDSVEYIPMDAEGLEVRSCAKSVFRANYVSMPYSPIEAAKRYLNAPYIACSDRAREILGKIINGKEINMDPVAEALSKKRAAKKNTKAQEIADSAAKHKQASDEKKAAAKKAAKKAAPKEGKKAKGGGGVGRGRGIGAFVKEKIAAGVAPEKIVEQTQAKFPGCKTNLAHISWYRARMKEAGELKD